MIAVQRCSQPRVLQKNAGKWLIKLKEAMAYCQQLEGDSNASKESLRQAKRAVEKAQNKYNHEEVKRDLLQMFHGKCAYCESKITVITYGAIEHFFPKSRYIDKTFDWENLLLSCDLCNDVNHKGVNFPVDMEGNPLLINPADGITDPGQHLEFCWDSVAQLATIYGRDERGCTVEKVFDLNGMNGRRSLVQHRNEYIKKLMALLHLVKLENPYQEKAKTLLKEACEPSAEYSAFAILHILPYLS